MWVYPNLAFPSTSPLPSTITLISPFHPVPVPLTLSFLYTLPSRGRQCLHTNDIRFAFRTTVSTLNSITEDRYFSEPKCISTSVECETCVNPSPKRKQYWLRYKENQIIIPSHLIHIPPLFYLKTIHSLLILVSLSSSSSSFLFKHFLSHIFSPLLSFSIQTILFLPNPNFTPGIFWRPCFNNSSPSPHPPWRAAEGIYRGSRGTDGEEDEVRGGRKGCGEKGGRKVAIQGVGCSREGGWSSWEDGEG